MIVLDSFLLELAAATLLFGLFIRYLPDIKLKWKDIWFGSLVTAALFGAGKYMIGFLNGEKIGHLDDLIIGSNANTSVAVVAVGGFLGIVSRMVAVPAKLIESNNQGQLALPSASKEELEAMPAFRYAKLS